MASKKATLVKAEAEAAAALAVADAAKAARKPRSKRTPTGGIIISETVTPEVAAAPEALTGAAVPATPIGVGYTDKGGQRRVSEISYVTPGDPKSLAVGELHRTRSRTTKSLVIVFRTTDQPVWVDPAAGKYAAVCVEHKSLEQYPTRAGAFLDWTRAPFCPECVRFSNYGTRAEGDPLAADAGAEADTGEGDSLPIEDSSEQAAEQADGEQAGEGAGEQIVEGEAEVGQPEVTVTAPPEGEIVVTVGPAPETADEAAAPQAEELPL